MVQDLQLEQSKAALDVASQESAAQDAAEREERLVAALTEAQSSLSNMQKLHEASQKQLFRLQTRDEEERVHLPPLYPSNVEAKARSNSCLEIAPQRALA